MSSLDVLLFKGKYFGGTTEELALLSISFLSLYRSAPLVLHYIHVCILILLPLKLLSVYLYSFDFQRSIESYRVFSQQMALSVRGLYFMVTLFLGSFFGSVFMLGPFLPLMLLSPAWYRWITDRIVATWLTLPVVCT